MRDCGHIPVLTDAVVELLAPGPGDVFVDCTAGRGGHAAVVLPRLAPGGRYIGLDLDPANVEFCRQRFADAPVAAEFVHANFRDIADVLAGLGVARVDGLLADLGFASAQLEDAARGLSFSADGPLDMRLDPTQDTTAADLVRQLQEIDLANLIYEYGEERLSRRIARKIVEARQRSPINTTRQLAELCARAYGPRAARGRIDPATRTFQALRIAVNGELENLRHLLDALPPIMKHGGRAAIISFHSLEDRMVKHQFRQWAAQGDAEKLTARPVTADDIERASNPRSRSAKLRAICWRGSVAQQ